jgi:hypothetical protein
MVLGIWTSNLKELGDFRIDGLWGGRRRPTVDNLALFVDQEFFKVPLRRSEINRQTSQWIEQTLIRVRPSKPDFWDLRYLNTPLASSPLTSDFAINGKVTPWLRSQKVAIPVSSSGS